MDVMKKKQMLATLVMLSLLQGSVYAYDEDTNVYYGNGNPITIDESFTDDYIVIIGSGSETATGNITGGNITINSDIEGDVFGGAGCGNAVISDNMVTVNMVTVNDRDLALVHGGYDFNQDSTKTSEVKNNTVIIKNGYLQVDGIAGGAAVYGSVSDNRVIIEKGNIGGGTIAGGAVEQGTVFNNHVEINGETVIDSIKIIGGQVGDGNAYGNSVSIDADINTDEMVCGAMAQNGNVNNNIVNINNSDGYLQLRVTTVDSYGTVLNAVWLKNESYGKEYTGEHQTTLVSSPESSSGTGLIVELSSTLRSGVDGVAGSGGTIQITSTNNLQLEASFTGNRIDTQDINYLDQPIISQYNHFTTYLEFKQPEITQVTIRVEAELSTTATITSGIILQNIKNNIQNLFNITPDYIGKGLKLSDIYTAVMKTEHVTWCRVLTPLDNIDVEKNGLLIASNITVVEKIPEYK